MKIIPKHSHIIPGQLAEWEEWRTCPDCNGTGKGEQSMEQGGIIKGICGTCAGYGKWKVIKPGWKYAEKCKHGFEKDVESPAEGMHRCACCGLNGKHIYIMASAEWPRTDPLCQDCRDAEGKAVRDTTPKDPNCLPRSRPAPA